MAEGFRKMATMNLEALQEISDRLMAELVQTGSRPRGDLTWKDFTLVSDEAMCVQGGMVFHAAKEKKNQDKNCVLMVRLRSDLRDYHCFSTGWPLIWKFSGKSVEKIAEEKVGEKSRNLM